MTALITENCTGPAHNQTVNTNRIINPNITQSEYKENIQSNICDLSLSFLSSNLKLKRQ